jgi:hypothetical protein
VRHTAIAAVLCAAVACTTGGAATADGHVVPVGTVLLDDDYRASCGSTLVLTAGHDRIATTSKRLVALLFVRERRGYGRAMLLRQGILFGPVAPLGYSLGFYGHHAWWLGATWHE